MTGTPPDKIRSGSLPYEGRSFSFSSCRPDGRCKNGGEKVPLTCAVRYGYMGLVGEFRYAPGVLDGCGGKVVIETQRGIEIGEQVSLTCSGCEQSVRREQITSYLETSNAPELYQLRAGRILRRATSEDLIEWHHIQADSKNKLARARETSKSVGLSMKFVACEHLFGGERIVFYFMADNRIDFRDMVRELAHEFHTRIEMHQVGARDEARLVADFEICGRECCCKNFLKKLRPVTMRMAKLQKATLDPTKVSGRCGRLRCCLRYEHEGYDELSRKLPRTGSRVRTASGVATVRDRQVLTQLLHVVYDDSEVEETIGLEAVLERDLPRRVLVRQEGDAVGRSTGDRSNAGRPGSDRSGFNRSNAGRLNAGRSAGNRSDANGAGVERSSDRPDADGSDGPGGSVADGSAADGLDVDRATGDAGGRRFPRRQRPSGRPRPSPNQPSAEARPSAESSGDPPGDPPGETAPRVGGDGESNPPGERPDSADGTRGSSSRRRSRGRRGRGTSRRRGPRPGESESGGQDSHSSPG